MSHHHANLNISMEMEEFLTFLSETENNSYPSYLAQQIDIEGQELGMQEKGETVTTWPKYYQLNQFTAMQTLINEKAGRVVLDPCLVVRHSMLIIMYITKYDKPHYDRYVRLAESLNRTETMKADILTYVDGEFIEGVYLGGTKTSKIPDDLFKRLRGQYKAVTFVHGSLSEV